jgi:hypothetical protein
MRSVAYIPQAVGVVSLWPDRPAGRALHAYLVDLRERVVNRTEIARGGTPCAASGYGLARVILILASDEASFIDGADFAGGESSMRASFAMPATQRRTALHIPRGA